jgi:hypothetical protein
MGIGILFKLRAFQQRDDSSANKKRFDVRQTTVNAQPAGHCMASTQPSTMHATHPPFVARKRRLHRIGGSAIGNCSVNNHRASEPHA